MSAAPKPEQRVIEVTCYLQIEPEFMGGTTPRVRSAKVAKMTQSRPSGTQRQGTIMAPITLRIPEGAFLPLSPRIVVDIPEHLISAEPIVVEAGDGTETPDA